MQSMTGVGKVVFENDEWRVFTLVKSVNSKGLDIFIKTNYNLSSAEINIRKLVREFITRGTVNVHIDVTPKKVETPVDIKKVLVNVQIVKLVMEELGLKLTDDTIFQTAWKYSEKTAEELSPQLEDCLYSSLREALRDLVRSRKEEGEHIKQDIQARLQKIEGLLEEIEKLKDQVLSSVKGRILERAKELGLPEVHPTVLNEITFILSRMDVDEELTRFKAHLSKISSLLDTEGDVGRKLDFTLQEIHREINTLGNKMPELSHLVVEIKSEIDRIRQQVANVE
ncbi:hypothetical protein HRbin13_00994 [bacterium HR13]|nr:hypothetical protein HRbin13_00994 [bacterium HR13]